MRVRGLLGAFTLLAPLLLVIQSPVAQAAVLTDAGNNCSLTVTSAGVTVDATSVPITVSGSNCVVQFKTVGTYTVTMPSDVSAVNYLVVGGGGGGASGGGGGGGVRQGTNFAVTPSSNYTVVVGDGGIAGSGGSGIVILSIPTTKYSATYTGTVTVTTSGANTILSFTGNGTYTA